MSTGSYPTRSGQNAQSDETEREANHYVLNPFLSSRKHRGVSAVARKLPNLSKPDLRGASRVNGSRLMSLNRPVAGRASCRTKPGTHAFFNCLFGSPNDPEG